MIVKRLFTYGIGILVVGFLLAGVTRAVLDFVPYFIAGMTLTTPLYGAMRMKSNKVRGMLKWLGKLNGMKSMKSSVSAYLIALVVVFCLHNMIGYVLLSTAKMGGITLTIVFFAWETTRLFCKLTKKYSIPSYGAAVRNAL